MSIITGAVLIVIGTLLLNVFLRGSYRRREAAASRSIPKQRARMETRCRVMCIPMGDCLAYAERPKVPALPALLFVLAAGIVLPDFAATGFDSAFLLNLTMGSAIVWYDVYFFRLMREAYFIVTCDMIYVQDISRTCRLRSYALPIDNILAVTLVHNSINEIATGKMIQLQLRNSMGYPANRRGMLILPVEPHVAFSVANTINALLRAH